MHIVVYLDITGINDQVLATQFYNPDVVYCITPVAEQLAKQYAVTNQPEPVTRRE